MAAQTGKIALTLADVAHRGLVTCLFAVSLYGTIAIGVQVDKSRRMRDERVLEQKLAAEAEEAKKPAQWFTRE